MKQSKSKSHQQLKAKKQLALRNKLLPRVFQYKLMSKNKKSSPQIVFVPPTHNVLGFATNSYQNNKQYLEKYIKQQQFETTVKKINDAIENKVMAHRKKQNTNIFYVANRLLEIATVFAVLGLIILMSIVYFDIWGELSHQQNIIQYVAAALLLASSVCAISGVITIQLKKFQKFNSQKDICTQLRTILSKQNQTLCQNKKTFLRWQVDDRFFELSLRINLDEIPHNYQPNSQAD